MEAIRLDAERLLGREEAMEQLGQRPAQLLHGLQIGRAHV